MCIKLKYFTLRTYKLHIYVYIVKKKNLKNSRCKQNIEIRFKISLHNLSYYISLHIYISVFIEILYQIQRPYPRIHK